MKKCSCCGEEKEYKFFQVRKLSTDGLTASCKECLRKRDRARYPKEREKRAESGKLYVATERGKAISNKAKNDWSVRNVIKRAASHIVNNAIRDGKIKKPKSCSKCNVAGIRIHGHHDDYAYPLKVRWLCSECHCAWHKENGVGKNG